MKHVYIVAFSTEGPVKIGRVPAPVMRQSEQLPHLPKPTKSERAYAKRKRGTPAYENMVRNVAKIQEAMLKPVSKPKRDRKEYQRNLMAKRRAEGKA